MSKGKEKKSKLSFTVPMDPPKQRIKRPDKQSQINDTKQMEASLVREASANLLEKSLILRLAVASLLFAFSIMADLTKIPEILFLGLSVVIASVDLIINAIKAVLKQNFFDDALLTFAVIILSFIIGFYVEACAFTILYQISVVVIQLLIEKSRQNALNMVNREEAIRDLLEDVLIQKDFCEIQMGSIMERNAHMPLVCAKVLAVLYAVIMPILSHYSIKVSIHRAIIILSVTTPFSMLVAMPIIGMISLGFSAANGSVFKNASALESLSLVKSLILDKLGFFHFQPPKILYAHSDVLDDTTFMTFVFHVVYNSEQRFAKIIQAEQKLIYQSNVVTEFKECDGGIQAKIGSSVVFFGPKSFILANGLKLPKMAEIDGVYYYLFLEGRFGGVVVLSEDDSSAISDIIQDFRYAGINSCILTCPESVEEVSDFAENSGFNEVFAGINPESHLQFINDICSSSSAKNLYITQESEEPHSKADIEIRIASEIGNADAVTYPDYFAGIPLIFNISRRMDEVAIENAVFVFSIKAVIIFLAMIGYCNLWMAVILETLAVAITVLNANRVTSNSVMRIFTKR